MSLIRFFALSCCLTLTVGCFPDPASLPTRPPMDEDATPVSEERFWEPIDAAVATGIRDKDKLRAKLVEELSEWSEDDLKGFKLQYIEQFNKLNRTDIRTVFDVINRVAEYEAFFAHRDFLIAQGSERMKQVLDDPESLLDDVQKNSLYIDETDFYMAGDSVIAKRTGNPADGLSVKMEFTEDPSGEPIDLEDETAFKQRFPRLAEFVERRNRMDAKQIFGQ
ncbi:MAG: DUF4240 domain-containing protein [Planctomycetota bacterium]